MLFNYKELAEKSSWETESRLSEIFISKYLIAQYLRVNSLEEDLFRLPTKNEHFFIQSKTAFNAITFLVLIVKVFSVKNLHISTYSISKDIIEALINLHDAGKVEQITILLAESKFKRNQLESSYLVELSKKRSNIKVLFANVNARVLLIETHENNYVVEGSANWNENAFFEQYLFACSKDLYNFRLQLFTNLNFKKQ